MFGNHLVIYSSLWENEAWNGTAQKFQEKYIRDDSILLHSASI